MKWPFGLYMTVVTVGGALALLLREVGFIRAPVIFIVLNIIGILRIRLVGRCYTIACRRLPIEQLRPYMANDMARFDVFVLDLTKWRLKDFFPELDK